MPLEEVFVHVIPGPVDAWIGDHIDAPGMLEEGELVLCNACSDALRFDGAKLLEAKTKKPLIEPVELQ